MKEIHQLGTIFGHRLLVEIEGDPKEIDFSNEKKKVINHIDKMNRIYLKNCVDDFISSIKK